MTLGNLEQYSNNVTPITWTTTPTDETAQATAEYQVTTSGTPAWTTQLPRAVGSYPVRVKLTDSQNLELKTDDEAYTTGTLMIFRDSSSGGSGSSAKVEIPVRQATLGTVAVLVEEDGTEKVIKTSLTTENGVIITLSDGDTVKIVENSKSFADVPSSYWGSEYIDFVTSREIFSGTGDRCFSPDLPMNRAMIVTVLAALSGADTSSTGGAWYEAGQRWAMLNGISDGTNMEQPPTREQLAVMLWNYAGKPQSGSLPTGYPDWTSTSGWAQQAMACAVEEGLISNLNGALAPQGTATRAQVATILMRFVEIERA